MVRVISEGVRYFRKAPEIIRNVNVITLIWYFLLTNF